MYFQVLASGSKGNMTYIETTTTKILLDAGITASAVSKRSTVDLKTIDAVFLTHEHVDHAGEINSILKKTSANIYVSKKSFAVIKNRYLSNYDQARIHYIEGGLKYQIGDISIMPLNLSHDSQECFGYLFLNNESTLAYITDTGFVPLEYFNILSIAKTIIIEANHDIPMLTASDRPWPLKQRILSTHGHLSNVICGQILNKLLEAQRIKKVILAHLSMECNDRDLAVATVKEYLNNCQELEIYVAKQNEALPLFEV